VRDLVIFKEEDVVWFEDQNCTLQKINLESSDLKSRPHQFYPILINNTYRYFGTIGLWTVPLTLKATSSDTYSTSA
jgi:hypothetical protein